MDRSRVFPASQAGDDRGVETATQEHADGHIAHQLTFDRPLDCIDGPLGEFVLASVGQDVDPPSCIAADLHRAVAELQIVPGKELRYAP